eukprot:m.323006 g.323006  ORF g.323006 m.323006 type:complete len:238 (-) comp28109_c0_seq1:159-872(-)
MDREELVFRAKMAERIESHKEMVMLMNSLAERFSPLTVEEMNLLSVAYKNYSGTQRAAFQRLHATEQQQADLSDMQRRVLQDMKRKVKEELTDFCMEVEERIESSLLPAADSPEAKVFFFKMRGDFFRYIIELMSSEEGDVQKQKYTEAALLAYKSGHDLSAKALPTTHPIRLALELNFSVFYFEILRSPDRAIETAQLAFSQACDAIEHLSDQSYKDSVAILRFLRENVQRWENES